MILSSIFPKALISMMRAIERIATLEILPSALKSQWPSMLKQWLTSRIRAQSSLIMETRSAMKRAKADINEHLNSQALFQNTFDRFSAKEKDHFDGLHSPEIPKILRVRIKRFWTSFLRISIYIAGSRWRKIALNLKDFRHVSVGLDMENAIRLG